MEQLQGIPSTEEMAIGVVVWMREAQCHGIVVFLFYRL